MNMRLNLARVLAILGGALNLIATTAIFVMPMYEGVSVTVTSSGERIEEHSRRTLLEMRALEPLTVVFFGTIVLLSLAAAFVAVRATHRPSNLAKVRNPSQGSPRRYGITIIAAGVLLLFLAFISGFSVGAFYLPGAVLVFVAGVLMAV